jgi:hypothetical protein
VADPVGAQRLDHLGDLLDAVVAAFLADVDGDAEAGASGLVDQRLELRVRVARAAGAGAGDVDADDPA